MAALSTGRCLLSILVLPCLASGLRLGPPEVGNGEGGSEISMGHFMREAARAERWGPVPVKPASIPAHSVNEYVINWTVKKVDPAAEIDIFFDHGCDSSHHASGQCTFERNDSVKNPGELLVKAPTAPLTAHAFFSVNMKVEVFSLSFEESTSCLVCDDVCVFKPFLPTVPTIYMRTAKCPSDEFGEMLNIMPKINLTDFPKFVRVHVKTAAILHRQSGEKVFEATMEEFI